MKTKRLRLFSYKNTNASLAEFKAKHVLPTETHVERDVAHTGVKIVRKGLEQRRIAFIDKKTGEKSGCTMLVRACDVTASTGTRHVSRHTVRVEPTCQIGERPHYSWLHSR